MSHISPAELMRRLGHEPDLCILDVRSPAEFDEVRIPRARNVPLDQFNTKSRIVRLRLPCNQPLYLICHSGSRAAVAASKLKEVGLRQTYVISGGTNGWVSAGLPVLRGEVEKPKPWSMERQLQIAAGIVVLLGVLLSFFSPYFIVLSAVIGAGLVLAGVTGRHDMGPLLAKAPWNHR